MRFSIIFAFALATLPLLVTAATLQVRQGSGQLECSTGSLACRAISIKEGFSGSFLRRRGLRSGNDIVGVPARPLSPPQSIGVPANVPIPV